MLGRKRLPYGDGSGVHEAAAQMKVSTDLDISGEPGSRNQAEFFAGIWGFKRGDFIGFFKGFKDDFIVFYEFLKDLRIKHIIVFFMGLKLSFKHLTCSGYT